MEYLEYNGYRVGISGELAAVYKSVMSNLFEWFQNSMSVFAAGLKLQHQCKREWLLNTPPPLSRNEC
jgi:hypothetical protein